MVALVQAGLNPKLILCLLVNRQNGVPSIDIDASTYANNVACRIYNSTRRGVTHRQKP